MSTSYYKLKQPFTSARLERLSNGVHERLTLWESGANVGTMTFANGGASVICIGISEISDEPPMRTHWGGDLTGTIVTDNAHLPDDTYLISEYGEPIKVSEIRQRHGARRSDNMPTELFGYEKSCPQCKSTIKSSYHSGCLMSSHEIPNSWHGF